jgi:hypothetical protein
MSALGQKQTMHQPMSASPPKRTLQSRSGNSAKNFSPIGKMFDQHFSDYKPIRFAGQWRERNGPVFYRHAGHGTAVFPLRLIAQKPVSPGRVLAALSILCGLLPSAPVLGLRRPVAPSQLDQRPTIASPTHK